MNFPRFFITLIATFFFHAVAAQSYTFRSIDFRDSINGKYLYSPELGAILLRGYLRGELKAYTFDIKQELSKFKPLPQEFVPDAWNPKSDYFSGDRVTYKGKYYEALMDIYGAIPEGNEAWWPLNLTGEAASDLHHFPTDADTTSKTEFLSKFIRYEDEDMGDPWSPTIDYYYGDVVEFDSAYYECVVDSRDRQPDKNTEHWRIRPRVLMFQNTSDLYGAYLIYAGIKPSPLLPQMFAVTLMDYEMGMFLPLGLNFKFQDVITYLSRQRELPLVCRSRLGYTGTGQMLIGSANANDVLHFLQGKLWDGKLTPAKKGILSAPDYDVLINTGHDDLTTMWSLTQDLNTNDLFISALRNDSTGTTTYTRTAKLAWKSVEPLLAAEVPEPRTWGFMEGLQSNLFNYSFTDTATFDTLQSMPYTHVILPEITERYFIDQRTASIASNPKLAQAIQALWQAITAAQLALQPNEVRPFLCDQPFHSMVVRRHWEWKVEEGFQLESTPEPTMDPKQAQLPAAGIVAEYRRVLTTQPSKAKNFNIQRLGIRLFVSEVGLYVDYFFKWDDVIKIIGARKDMQELVDAVEKGTLVFDTQSVVGGLVGVVR